MRVCWRYGRVTSMAAFGSRRRCGGVAAVTLQVGQGPPVRAWGPPPWRRSPHGLAASRVEQDAMRELGNADARGADVEPDVLQDGSSLDVEDEVEDTSVDLSMFRREKAEAVSEKRVRATPGNTTSAVD
mmetsp:Transcript_55522/g.119843  ORF Transcript_55522/g.119843 Transcript_55522/m.119843 type:complete len:129 (+) Transcript_55522:1-387(+)